MKRQPKLWENHGLLHKNRREGHSYLKRAPQTKISLNGLWRFVFLEAPEYAPEGFYKTGFDASGWEEIAVPSCWQLQGYGEMHYTDVWYPFPINPPFVPSKNPTGLYRRSFTAPFGKGEKTILRFNGVDSAFEVWVNGEYCGYSKVSRLASEFDITPFLQGWENTLAVRVVQWSDGTYLEDQDMWWLSGIFRDVELYAEPEDGFFDCGVQAGLAEDFTTGELEITALLHTAKAGRCIEWKMICEETGEVVAKGRQPAALKEISFSAAAEKVKPWSAEFPSLYKIEINLLDEDGKGIDSFYERVGFRDIQVKDGEILLNGTPLFFNGVNYHESSPDTGRTVTPEFVERDLRLMKAHNINAVRCAHYPRMDYFYELCDRMGFYVIDEADLEDHGFEWIKRYNWLCDDPAWKEAFVDRAARMVQQNKNHPSILMWSLGNESFSGPNFEAAAEAVRKLDDTRLVHYEGDFEADYTDVYSTMYTRLPRLEEIGAGTERHNKPHVLCEYAHAMGNGPGGLQEYQEIFRKHKRLSGGFIWEWCDHGIRQKKEDGSEIFLHGDDFGTTPNNSNFCIDGLVMPDRTPSPGLLEAKQVFAPVDAVMQDKEKGIICLKNRYAFKTLGHLELCWALEADGVALQQGVVGKLADILPSTEKEISIPYTMPSVAPGTDVYLTVCFILKEATLYEQAGSEIARRQFLVMQALPAQPALPKNTTPVEITQTQTTVTLEAAGNRAVFNKIFGRLEQYESHGEIVIQNGPKLAITRGTIDNDMYQRNGWEQEYFIWNSDEQLAGLEKQKLTNGSAQVEVQTLFGCSNQAWGFDCNYVYTMNTDGVLGLSLKIDGRRQASFMPAMLPRVGVVMNLPKDFETVTWYGKGFGENYSDSAQSSWMGVYTATVEEMQTPYVVPQENGHREGVRWLNLQGEKQSLHVNSREAIGINVQPYTNEALEKARHRGETEQSPYTVVHLDVKHSGLGSNSCGPEQSYPHKTLVQDYSMELTFTATPQER